VLYNKRKSLAQGIT